MSLSELNNVNGKSLIILIWRKSILIKAEFLLLSTRQTWHAHRYWSRPALASGTHPPEPLHTFLSQTEIPSTQSFALSTPAETWSQFQGGLPVAKNKRELMMLQCNKELSNAFFKTLFFLMFHAGMKVVQTSY